MKEQMNTKWFLEDNNLGDLVAHRNNYDHNFDLKEKVILTERNAYLIKRKSNLVREDTEND